jgi:formylglycine-generating enzyme required for sulfatase activity
MTWIPGGTFAMGSENFYPEERPVHQADVSAFWIDTHEVTNAQFRRFVDDAGYVTIAERAPDPTVYPDARPEDLVPGSLVFRRTSDPVNLDDYRQWWQWVPGADWRHPLGPRSSLKGLDEHPVVHVAYDDADAYARWAGKVLPTEPEWEFAARGGLPQAAFCWGDEMEPEGRIMANTWLGDFPWRSLKKDGYRTTPVGSYPPNGYGLYDMAGNVWEWTSDWYAPHADALENCCAVSRRTVSEHESYDRTQEIKIPRKVIKGGSHLCAPNYCLRFRPAARQPETIETGTSHLGFRCVRHP